MKSKLLKITVIFTILTFLSKIIGLVRDMMIASTYGATAITDAYNVALTVPNILYMICASAIMITFIPNFYEVEKEQGEKAAYNFANKFMTILLIVSLIFYIVSMFNVNHIVGIIAPNLDNQILDLTIKLTKITLINLIFSVIASVYSSVLRSKDKYIGTSLMPIIANVPIILFLMLNIKSNNIVLLTIVTSFGFLIQFIILIPELNKIGFRYKFNLKGYNDRVLDIFKKVIPIMVSLAVTQISVIVDKSVASSLGQGTITSLDLSNKLTAVIYGILASTIITVFSPVLAKQFLQENKKEWLNTINSTIIYMLLLTIPIAVGAYILNEDIVSLIYQRGNFTQENVALVSAAFIGYLLQLPFLSIRDIIGQAFYSSKNTKIPAINGAIAVILNIILTVILAKKFGVFGITFGTSISLILSAFLLVVSFKNKYRLFSIKKLITDIFKIGVISLIMGGAVFFVKKNLLVNFSHITILIICSISGVAIQGILYKIFNIPEFIDLFNIVVNKIGKNNG